MEEPGGSEGFRMTPPGVLVEGEGSSIVRAQEPGLGASRGHHGHVSLVFLFCTFQG